MLFSCLLVWRLSWLLSDGPGFGAGAGCYSLPMEMEEGMGIKGWIGWFERIARGERKARTQALAYAAVLLLLAVGLAVMERAG